MAGGVLGASGDSGESEARAGEGAEEGAALVTGYAKFLKYIQHDMYQASCFSLLTGTATSKLGGYSKREARASRCPLQSVDENRVKNDSVSDGDENGKNFRLRRGASGRRGPGPRF